MPAPRHAIAATSADDVAFAGNQLSWMEVVDIGADRDDLPYKLMADHQGNRDCPLRPRVPVVDVNVCAADSGPENAHEDVVDADRRFGDVLQPQPLFGAGFDEGFHGSISRSGALSETHAELEC